MAGAIAVLRDLHRLRRHLKSLQDEIARAPIQMKARQASVARQEQELAAAHEDLNKTKVEVRQNEGTLKQAHQQIARFEQQRNEITSKKEYDAIQHEIAAARQKCSELEDVILEGMGRADEQAARIPEVEKALAKAREEAARFQQTSAERLAALSAEAQRAQDELKQTEENLPEDIRQSYDRLVASRGEDAMSLARNRTCSACYTGLTEQNYNDLLAGRLVLCKSCGRIVYLGDEGR